MSSLIQIIRESVIGDRTMIPTPFGERPLIYADYTASGRSLRFIEDFISERVLPYYANTHTETSFSGAQTTQLREQARQQIRSSVNGTEDDMVIFCGSGATAAINKLIDILNLRLPSDLDKRYQLQQNIPTDQRPLVLIGPYEHHSNELPWRESIADLICIPLTPRGELDLAALESHLKREGRRPLIIGSFSAASNVTGIKTDVDAVSRLLHSYGALAFWDYAAAAPYVGIDMTGTLDESGDSSKDAVFISPHKFIGGPGTPGILVVKRHLLKNSVPAVPGGGTVVYVTPDNHRYTDHLERREEGGTPAIIESIRAGLVFKLQQQVGIDTIETIESDFAERAIKRFEHHPNIEVLGCKDTSRLSITSLRIRHADKDLHYGFVVALLNDLFGIQARGGCSCAGPYGHSLLNMTMSYSRALETQIAKGHTVLRPGWVRVNFNYFIDEDTFEYMLRAIELVAEHGWRLLPFYQLDTHHNVWRYQGQPMTLATSIETLDFASMAHSDNTGCKTSLAEWLAQAERELFSAKTTLNSYSLTLSPEAEALRWFALPQDAFSELETERTDNYRSLSMG
ncbi:MAG TPA: aminotransferase class V-fold PLP-dependent enzyme [Pseudomonadales bacterium]|nr:aminotransferase class V-fold PLP-dependent enzyme [Pseudomonadales bacterium]